MGEIDLKTAPRVPETLLRRKAVKFASSLNKGRKRKDQAAPTLKRAEHLVAEFRRRERSGVKAQRTLRKKGADSAKREFAPKGTKSVFVIRIRASGKAKKKSEIPESQKSILSKLRLGSVFSGSLIKFDSELLTKLKAVESLVTWGYPNTKTIKDLIYKRGFTVIDGGRVPLTDNSMIEAKLGDCGVICTEDIVHELTTCGENFDRVNQFLAPFRLGAPKRGFTKEQKATAFTQGGEYGNRGDLINELISGMN